LRFQVSQELGNFFAFYIGVFLAALPVETLQQFNPHYCQ